MTDFIDAIEMDLAKRRREKERRTAVITDISGEKRMLVKGKGWCPFKKITWYDSVKTLSGDWIQAMEVPELQEKTCKYKDCVNYSDRATKYCCNGCDWDAQDYDRLKKEQENGEGD
jgi:hypothetical protein